MAGRWIGADWVILEGLKAGDKVIVDNLIKLRPGSPVSPHAPGDMPTEAPLLRPPPTNAGRKTNHYGQLVFHYTADFFISHLDHYRFGRAGCRHAVTYRPVSPDRSPTVLITATYPGASAETLTRQ